MEDINHSNLSYKLTKQISNIDKKNNGIYFTSQHTIHKNIEILKPYMKHIKNVLEPSCGSCEYILELNKMYNNLNILGIEYNEIIYNSIKSFKQDNIELLNEDYLKYKNDKLYDLIIGNPPYYVMKKNNVEKMYYNYFDGRPNIFILFIIKSLKILNDNGILSFILPVNFLNCLYYNKTREYISQYYKIIHISYCNNDYIDTSQETIIFIIQKNNDNNNNNKFIINNNTSYTIFGISENVIKINSLYNNSTTLQKMGFKVNVGNIVWNQCKDILTNDNSKTLLIYSSDIKSKKLNIQTYSNESKKNYIDKEGDNGLLLVINRGYGKGCYNFEYCLIEIENDYLVENHLICIKYTKTISKKELKILYKKIIKSFDNDKTKEFVKLYFGNNAINTTELYEILPIYDI